MPALAAPGTASRPPWGTEVLPRRPAGRCQAPAAPNPQFWGVQLIPVAQASPRPLVTSRGGENAQGVNQGGWLTKTTASIEADLPFFFCMRLLTSALRKQRRHGALRAPSPTHPHSGTSRDHGVGWVGRDLKAHPIPTPLPLSSPGLFPLSWQGWGLGVPSGTGDFARDSASGASDLPPACSCF